MLGKVSKGVECQVAGCGSKAFKSVPVNKLGSMAARVRTGRGVRRAYLCEKHYKEWKRLTKKERSLERLRFK